MGANSCGLGTYGLSLLAAIAMAQAPGLRFTRVKLRNWRNFRETEVRLGERAFLVGPNASGKSNFLSALRFLRDIAKPTGGLSAALELHGGFSAIRCLHARNPSDIEFDVDVGHDDQSARWRYVLRLQRFGSKRPPEVVEERVYSSGREVAAQTRPKAGSDLTEFSQTNLEQVQVNREFRELVEFFASIRYLHVVPQIVRDPRRHLSAREDPHGGDLLRRIKETPEKTRGPRLRRINDALSVAVPQFGALELINDSDGQPHLQAGFKHWRKNAAKQTEEQFSDGTLRFIGFLWSITERGGPLLLEEPELSLSDGVVQRLPAMLKRAQRLSRRQVIATTHSYAMLAAEGVGIEEVHNLRVGTDGSEVETIAANPEIVVRIEAGETIADAILPLTTPTGAHRLADLNVLSR